MKNRIFALILAGFAMQGFLLATPISTVSVACCDLSKPIPVRMNGNSRYISISDAAFLWSGGSSIEGLQHHAQLCERAGTHHMLVLLGVQ